MMSTESNSEKSVSYQKKDGCGHACPSFFWYDNDKDLKVCFLVARARYTQHGMPITPLLEMTIAVTRDGRFGGYTIICMNPLHWLLLILSKNSNKRWNYKFVFSTPLKCHIASSRYNYLIQYNIEGMQSNYLLQSCQCITLWCNTLFAFVLTIGILQ